jgi:hypothetical protein
LYTPRLASIETFLRLEMALELALEFGQGIVLAYADHVPCNIFLFFLNARYFLDESAILRKVGNLKGCSL